MICSKVKWSWWIASKQIMLRLKKLNKFITNETLELYLTTYSKNFICNFSQCARKFFKFLTNSEWPLFEVRTFSKFSDEISGLTRVKVLRPNLQSWKSHLGFYEAFSIRRSLFLVFDQGSTKLLGQKFLKQVWYGTHRIYWWCWKKSNYF